MDKLSFASLFFQLVAGFLPLMVIFLLKRKITIELTLYLLLSFISTLTIMILVNLKLSCALIFDTWHFITIVLLTIFYFRTIELIAFKIITLILGVLVFTNSIWEYVAFGYPNNALVIENISFIIIPILMYLSVIKESDSSMSNSFILINSSLFIYKTSTFLLFFFLTDLLKNNLWYIHNFIEGLSKLLIAYALWKLPKPIHSLA